MKSPNFKFWLRNCVTSKFGKHRPSAQDHFFVVSKEPTIIYRNVKLDPESYTPFTSRDVHFLIRFWWSFENEYLLKELFKTEKRVRDNYPNLKFTYCCNSSREVEMIRERGGDAFLCSHNAFTDANRFFPMEVDKRFDAIYDAQLLEFKRHCLASKVRSLSLVSFIHENLAGEYHKNRVSSCLAHAHWYNNPMTSNWRRLDHDELRIALNEARVGLCLSAEEGGMKAAIQYLLCGLPVVSTVNRGGRDEFFSPDFAATVMPDPSAIADAVTKFVANPPDPTKVRAAALEIIEMHRNNFVQKVNEISLAAGGPGYTHAHFSHNYVPGLLKWQSVKEVLSEIAPG